MLEAKCSVSNFDVIAITEFFLQPDDPDNHLALNRIKFLRHDHVGKEGGRVGVYVRDVYSVNILDKSDPEYDNTPEFLIFELISSSFKILVAVLYRRPSAAYLTIFANCLALHLPHYENVVAAGDFNINMVLPNAASAHLLATVDSLSLNLVQSEPTHHFLWRTPSSHTWLDLFLVINSRAF